MPSTIVAIAIDKIQSFLFYSIRAQKQEAQSDSRTLGGIIQTSRMISETFSERIGMSGKGGEFSGQIEETLLFCSGTCIFSTLLGYEQVMEKLDRLFQEYYLKYEGQLLLKYVCFSMEDLSGDHAKLAAIKEGKMRLRRASCLNETINRHKNLIFTFQNVEPNVEKKEMKNEKFSAFVSNINELKEENRQTGEKYFRVAIIKADLDGMGELFGRIKTFDAYKTLSGILYNRICLESFAEEVSIQQRKDPELKVYPLYVAGDDILFAVPVSCLKTGIDLCLGLLKKVNEDISCQISNGMGGTDAVEKGCSLSIGVELSYNHEPIRYYYERVQQQLDVAKKGSIKRENESNNNAYNKICINDHVFYEYTQEEEEKVCESYWPHFLHSLRLLDNSASAGIKVHSYLYGLLNKITDPETAGDKIALSNAVLYHLIPEYLDSQNRELRECELLLIELLLKPVTVKEHITKNIFQSRLCFDGQQVKKLKKLLQLYLVFSDERFQIKRETRNISGSAIEDDKARKRIRSVVFNRVQQYLYDNSLQLSLKEEEQSEAVLQLRNIFVNYAKYPTRAGQNGNQMPGVYQTLKISSSMFHRMKKMNSQIAASADMIQSVNVKTKEEYEKQFEERRNAFKTPPDLYFNEEQFIKLAEKTGAWTERYIDSLLILYRYKECTISYKQLYPVKNMVRKVKPNYGIKNKPGGGYAKGGKKNG